jgi:nicotinate phosphoribosyltransferase
MEPIIQSRLDNDIYKLYTQQFILHNFPQATAEFEFKCRTPGVDFSPIIGQIKYELENLCVLRYTQEEIAYLSCLNIFSDDYLSYLETEQLKMKNIEIGITDGELDIMAKGRWLESSPFEIPILSIVEELYFRHNVHSPDIEGAIARLEEKIKIAKEGSLIFSDFGTRRRFSRSWQEFVINILLKNRGCGFTGTSNPYFAMQHGRRPVGTQPHEIFQAMQALVPLKDSIKATLELWLKEYRGKLAIALTDILGMDAFLRDFDEYFAKMYDGCRQDSGDPIQWGEKLITHYEKLGIDSKTKIAVFSDGLDFPKAVKIAEHFNGRLDVRFGIGTNLMNDIPGVTPLQIVMKMTKCNSQAVAKISDSPGKEMCTDKEYLAYLKKLFQIKE